METDLFYLTVIWIQNNLRNAGEERQLFHFAIAKSE
ncbi:hypothetical protein L905_20490 [Agrobacterium sp. TS43]|nr:hypothetical protein L906_09650 [Agrobacterium sp. TS45]KVK62131.1 hypothetical protein L907_07895 [Agrobacterium sp. C13]KVK63101.1 hypothetical protein L905_20490 [Agrobacterium sp. TS43]